MLMRISLGLVTSILLLSVGCSPKKSASTTPELQSAPAVEPSTESGSSVDEESSVRPGMNDRFLEAETPDAWVERFEKEGREVFDEHDAILRH